MKLLKYFQIALSGDIYMTIYGLVYAGYKPVLHAKYTHGRLSWKTTKNIQNTYTHKNYLKFFFFCFLTVVWVFNIAF